MVFVYFLDLGFTKLISVLVTDSNVDYEEPFLIFNHEVWFVWISFDFYWRFDKYFIICLQLVIKEGFRLVVPLYSETLRKLAKYQNMSQSFWLGMASSAGYIYFLVRSCQYCFGAESVCLHLDSIYVLGWL